MRLDSFLVKNNLAQSRTKAQELIKNALVSVDGKVVKKSSFLVEDGLDVVVAKHDNYVSRSAHKLNDFFKELHVELKGLNALDIGSSTGGFTQVLLEWGVKSVSAVDVGSNQLHKSLRDDVRINLFEGCDIREFQTDEKFDIVVSDVAFISLSHILSDVDRLSKSKIILLFKPQFEVGKDVKRDKHGVVLDKKAVDRAMIKFEDDCSLRGWRLVKKLPSSLKGKEGNQEWCYFFEKGGVDG